MGHSLRKLNSIRDEHNGRRRRGPICSNQDPQTTPTRFGRKYIMNGGSRNGEMKYPLPTNAEEKKMWFEDHHYLIRHLWQKDFCSPVEEILKRGGANVLDIGCGAGAWSLEMAKNYPKSNFIGVDIAPMFPANVHENNLKFTLANLLEGLPFEDNTFDLVFARFVGGEESVWRELVRLTKPGSWLEITQADSEFYRCGKNFERWNQALLAVDMNSATCERSENWLFSLFNEGKISSINHEVAISPIGTWAGEPGEFGVSYVRHLSSRMKPQLINQLNVTEVEYNRMMEIAEQECNQLMTHRLFHRFMGQKR